MPLFKRQSSAQHAPAADRIDAPLLVSPERRSIRPQTSTPNPKLLTSDQVPPWYAQNDYIRGGYRPVTRSVYLCIHSLFYLHNETVNIYSHLVPTVIALLGNHFLHIYFRSHFPFASTADQFIFHLYLTTSIVCFGVSSAYHSLLCHSEHYAGLWVRLDYVAIVFQILGSFSSGVYFGFYCELHLQILYWAMIGSLGLVTAFVVVHPKLQGKKWSNLRTSSFVATGLSAFAPIIHAASIFPYSQLDKQAGLKYYYLEGLSILTGVVFFTLHFPERWKPGRFDIWGASHQIFHSFVVLGVAIHFYAILEAFEWNYVHQRCKQGWSV